ncbi:MAG: DNA cytosine methyltransferase, partial [Verrucomicrobiota bacterium]
MDQKPKYIDLFAGCGGLSTGLHAAGWKGVFAIEKNPSAFETLKANLVEKRSHFDWPAWLAVEPWDIEEIIKERSEDLRELRGSVDLIVGGPPCQGFSTAGRREENDSRNSLVHNYLRVVELVLPDAILFENVRGFTMKFKANTESGAPYSEIVIRRLKELGYEDACGRLIDMSEYGVPQRRQRFIVIATRRNLAKSVFETLDQNRQTHLF